MKERKYVLLYYVNTDRGFLSHRLELAKKALSEGYEVHLMTNITDYKKYIENEGIVIYESNLSRGFNILKDIFAVFSFVTTVLKIKPDIIHSVSNKNNIICGFLANFLGVKKIILAVSGLGYIFIKKNLINKIARKILSISFNLAINRKDSFIIVQNSNDQKIVNNFIRKKLKRKNVVLIKGSGVNTKYFYPVRESEGNLNISLVARMIYDKGIREFVEAAIILKKKYIGIEFNLYGDPDRHNPSSIPIQKLNEWNNKKIINWRGHVEDTLSIYHKSHIIVLPSYREGMPKAILEASACGRPCIVTNVAGCNESIKVNQTGLLVELYDVNDLVDKIELLILNRDMRIKMGKEARIFSEKVFDINMINSKQLNLYKI
tara:strand:- start:2523 stop:3650 length:1128 start_codon:yes stop_codon:yes gene_type:complete